MGASCCGGSVCHAHDLPTFPHAIVRMAHATLELAPMVRSCRRFLWLNGAFSTND